VTSARWAGIIAKPRERQRLFRIQGSGASYRKSTLRERMPMPRKAKTSVLKKSKGKGNVRRSPSPYPSLVKGAPAARRLAEFLKTNAADSVKPMTENELENWLSKFPNLWPDDAEIDQFVTWLHQARRDGRYR
jgi:hypothetical protein